MTNYTLDWDEWGTPSIEAADWPKAMHGFGYAQAYAHPNLLMVAMLRGQGIAAEVLGQHSGLPEQGLTKQPNGVDYIASDRLVWQLDVAQLGRDYWQQQDPDMGSQVQSFCDGINACRVEHKHRFDERFHHLDDVTPNMVMAHVAHILVGFQVMIRQPTIVQWMQGAQPVLPSWSDFAGAGSNACVIGPSKSTHGHPMLACNPHTQWDVDLNTFTEAHISLAGRGYVGATMVGWPGLLMACNAQQGFAGTVNTQSSLSFYQLAVTDGQFALDGVNHALSRKPHTIKCLEADGSHSLHPQEQCWSQQHQAFAMAQRPTTAQPPAREQQDMLLMAYAARPHGQVLRQLFDMTCATSLAQFQTAQRQHQLPMFNILYAGRDEADDQGHIQYSFHSMPPARERGTWSDWWQVLDGEDSANICSGLTPYEALFQHQDADSGWYQNCNDSPYSCTLPAPFNAEDYPAWLAPVYTNFRAQNYSRSLASHGSFDFDEFVAAKFSTRVELADRLLPQLLAAIAAITEHAEHEQTSLLQQCAQVLTQWDRQTQPNSRGSYLFLQWVLHQPIEDAVASPLFADQWDYELAANAQHCLESLNTPNQLADINAAVEALVAAAQGIQAQGLALDVAWQQAVDLQHGKYQVPAVGGPGDPLGIISAIPVNPSLRPQIKGGTLVANRIENDGGETFVMMVEFTPQGARGGTFLSYGSSSVYADQHNGDQLELLAKRQLRAFSINKISENKR